jgi:dCTP deaminase
MTDNVLDLFPELARDVNVITTGVFPSQLITQLIESGRISAAEPIANDQIQPASLDLRLGHFAYRMQASFLPGRQSTVEKKLADLSMAKINLQDGGLLERGAVYLIPLLEQLWLPENVSGKANPKSTTGRLDVFTRIITDYSDEFERISAGYQGPLYAEVVPRTFSIVVQPGMRLSQLRLMRGKPLSPDAKLSNLHDEETLVFVDEQEAEALIEKGLKLSVSLRGSVASEVIAFRAKRNAPIIDLAKIDFYDPAQFWDPITSQPDGRLILNPGDFYILASRERVRVPPLFAAEMVPFDPSVGEFRIHYAGFFDPGFGYGLKDIQGTKAVLEVRAHEVPFLIEDGQIVGRLIYVRMMGKPDRIYGVGIGSSYQRQGLALAKQFRRSEPS